MRKAVEIELSEEERAYLAKAVGSGLTSARHLVRCQIVLLASEGIESQMIAGQLEISRQKVARWRNRFALLRVEGIEQDRPGRGCKKQITAAQVAEVIRRTTQERPEAQTHWSTRTMSKATGHSASQIRRLWQEHGLKPHLATTFKVSNDPRFAEKLEDIVGLYLHAPAHALVLCCDEKSQVQALDRTQPGLPMKKGRAETFTHDYVRHGTTTLFAALNVADGKIISTCQTRHRHQEWLKFLQQIDRETEAQCELHLIVDNYATHKHAKVKTWLAKHPRFHLHFTPTSASWLNMVERFFRDLTTKRLRRGVFKSLPDLIAAIESYIAHHNHCPNPFIWTAKANDILAKVQRARKTLDRLQ